MIASNLAAETDEIIKITSEYRAGELNAGASRSLSSRMETVTKFASDLLLIPRFLAPRYRAAEERKKCERAARERAEAMCNRDNQERERERMLHGTGDHVRKESEANAKAGPI